MSMASILYDAALRHPERKALVDDRQAYTFRELEALSSQFARYLLSSGAQHGDRIAFCAPKSATLVVAMLGCLKAGASYVPIDHALPRERLRFILDEVSPRFIVCAGPLYQALASELERPGGWLDADRLADYFDHPGPPAALPRIAPDDVAYCIYTSGSTGRPKGVLIEHDSVDVFFDALAEVMTIDSSSRCMNTSALYFDVHVMDLFFPLSRGATVHLSCGPIVADTLLRTLERERITHFTAVGPVMTLMAERELFTTCNLSWLVRVMTGAEVINVATMQKWLRKVPGLSLVNGYGPTEVTVICTAYIIDRIEPDRTAGYPIGRPMRGSEALLVDTADDDRVVSEPEMRGELLIGGPQVMKGYWQNEQQTRDRVVTIDGRRYYRTGDICQWRADGDLDYIGRNDDEIKLSGFRIDLNEIKRVMDAARVLNEGHPIVIMHPVLGKVIGACFTTATMPTAGRDDAVFKRVQTVLKSQLPYYMVPSLYLLFDRFPLSPSGKTDKKALVRIASQYVQQDTVSTRFVCEVSEETSHGNAGDLVSSPGHAVRRSTDSVPPEPGGRAAAAS
jgi:amino acid adenylation domain-containing protein